MSQSFDSMLPRYLPALTFADVAAARRAGAEMRGEALRGAMLAHLHCDPHHHALAYPNARSALRAWFSVRREQTPARAVVMSAQICPVVPQLLQTLGFRPHFVDLAAGYPCPGEEELLGEALALHGRGELSAVIIAPFYGYSPADWGRIARLADEVPLVLDLAQGFALEHQLAPLLKVAQATIFSFGLGKGPDTGGGLLVTPAPIAAGVGSGHLGWSTPAQGLGLRVLCATGLYGWLTGALEAAVGANKSQPAPIVAEAALTPASFITFDAGAQRMTSDIERAREHAQALFSLPAVVARCSFPELYADTAQSHLRQILRLRDPGERNRLVATLRGAGIDAVAAGEDVPSSYMTNAPSLEAFPNTAAFLADSVRLPFLGRVSGRRFDRFSRVLENAFG
jgi:dTDP-4-amino-4,6-dideoxygalactose transaminase